MSYILQTNHLTKTIDGKELVKDVSLHIKKGEIYGFLGPNGAGKTTVMKMLTNLWKPTDGSIEILGETLTPQSYEVLNIGHDYTDGGECINYVFITRRDSRGL